jgi:hypothetical protein
MKIKLFEIRDEGTHIPAFAISTRPLPGSVAQNYLLRRAGFESGNAVILGYLCGERHSSADPYFWGNRTMKVAHEYITEHFDELAPGAVVDVEFIMGITKKPKVSERVSE